MTVQIRLAETAYEIETALRIRHDVLIIEDGKYGGTGLQGRCLVDRFDALPTVFHMLAYDGTEPVGTMRLVRDSEVGMPVDDLYDFRAYRAQVSSGRYARFGSAGMLAIRRPWRRRRDVLAAMFSLAAAVCHDEGTTHVLVVVNHENVGMYRRLGLTPLRDKFWDAAIGNAIVPLAGLTEDFLRWAQPRGALRVVSSSPFVLPRQRGGHAYTLASDPGAARLLVRGNEETHRRFV